MQQAAKVSDIQTVSKMVIEYGVTNSAIAELEKRFGLLEIVDTKSYREVQSAIGEVRGYRVQVEKKRKELKAEALEYGRKVDGEAKRITALLIPIEEDLKAKKQAVDDQKAAEKAEKERIEAVRIEGIRKKIADIQRMTVGLNGLSADQLKAMITETESIEITPEEYAEFILEAKQAKAEVANAISQALGLRIRLDQEEAERKAEAERLAKIQAEQEAERKRLEAENAKLLAAQRAEEQRIAEEQAKIDAENRRIAEEKAAMEAEKQAEIARKEREALEKRLAAEAKVKADQEAKEQVAREEAERIASEKAEAEEAARQEALKPDKEKLNDFALSLSCISAPKVKSDEAAHIADSAIGRINEIAKWVMEQINEM